MKKAELRELLELREAQLSNTVNALRHAEQLISYFNLSGNMDIIRKYPIIHRDNLGVIRVKIGLLFGGSDEQGVE